MLIVSCFFLQEFSKKSVALFSGQSEAMVEPPPEYLGVQVNPKVVKRLLGIRLAAADFIWVDLLLKSDIQKETEPYSKMYVAAHTMLTLDPDNFYAYYLAGIYLSIIKNDVKGATSILRDGVTALENAGPITKEVRNFEIWKLYFMLGYNLIFEEQAIDEGSFWVKKAAGILSSPLFVKELALRISTEQGQLELANRLLTDLHRRSTNEAERKKVEEKMLAIAIRQDLLDLNSGFQKYLTTTSAYALPKEKAFNLFLRSINRKKEDLVGRPLILDASSKIVSATN